MKSEDTLDSENLSQSEDEIVLSRLMKSSLQGDSDSYRQLLEKVKDLMTPFIANCLSKYGLGSSGGHDDVLQEILLAIHTKRATFDPDQFFLPWMYAIARYKAIDFLRRNKVAFKTISIEDSIEEFEINQTPDLTAGLDIQTLCENLSTKQRDLLLMVKVEGLSINEAATKTGFSESDVKVTIHRALKELKKKMKESRHEI